MEQYTKESGIDMGSQQSARTVVAVMDVSNGQTKTISTTLLEESGSNSVLNAIETMTRKNSVGKRRGTKATQVGNIGMTLQGLNQHGIVVLKPRKKSVVDIVEKSFTRQRKALVSVPSHVRCSKIKELVYLLESDLIKQNNK